MPVATPDPQIRKPANSGVVVPHEPVWYQRLVARIVFALERIVGATLRYKWIDRSGFFDGAPPPPAIYCVWHNRLPLSMKAYFGYVKKRNTTPGLAAMVSASKDGGFLAA